MGFGSGYSQRHDRGGKRYNNTMTAHVWNAQSELSGQSSNGNFFFRDATLYSYGTHFVVGIIMPDGVAFLNGDSYSISTSAHQSDARQAVKNRSTFTVKGLTKIADTLESLARGKWRKGCVRDTLRTYAAALTAPLIAAGESLYGEYVAGYRDESTGQWVDGHYIPRDTANDLEAGAYIARLAGLPAASWPKAKRDAETDAKRKAVAEAKAERVRNEKRALQLADMSDSRFRDMVANLATGYSDYQLREIGKQLKRARSLMLKATSGKLASASRLSIIRERVKRVELGRGVVRCRARRAAKASNAIARNVDRQSMARRFTGSQGECELVDNARPS